MKRLALALALCATAAAQQMAAPPAAPVRLVITATDKQGDALPDLKAEDLKIQSDKHPVDAVKVEKLSGPMHYCLLFDSSNSGRFEFELEKKAALAFLARVPRPGVDIGLAIGFNSELEVSDESSDPALFSRFLAAQWPHGGTALFDALGICVKRLNLSGTGLKAAFIFSDGADNDSRTSRQQARELSLRAGVQVHFVGVFSGGPESASDAAHAARVLGDLITETGGQSYSIERDKDVDKVVHAIQQRTQNAYLVSFAGPASDGRLHGLELRGPKNVRLAAPSVYWAQQQ